MTRPSALFVTYGGGHAQMVLPVVQWLREHALLDIKVLALTTAAPVFERAGIPTLGFRNFLRATDEAALVWGERLLPGNSSNLISVGESVAYLGLSYVDLEHQLGVEAASAAYRRFGRQAFRPLGVLRRVIEELTPSVVVATSSPRAERAVIEAAGQLQIPSVCMVDLFAMDEIAWVGQPGYASKVCVMNQAVADRFLAQGRTANDICVTGNPAFDGLRDTRWMVAGKSLRAAQGWNAESDTSSAAQVVLWAAQPEPAEHPSVPGRNGDTGLPGRIQQALEQWACDAPGRTLVVRPHPSEPVQAPSPHAAVIRHGRDFDLLVLLHAVDGVVTMNSTVGLQAHLAGKPVIQVLGSMFDDSVPLAAYGMAQACHDPAGLPFQIPLWLARQVASTSGDGSIHRATEAVARVILGQLPHG